MAERRMFTMRIIDSDAFLDMPLSAQALYFHLNMRADDDGFINNPKRTLRTIGAAEDDLKLLLAKRFVIGFERGVIVIKHWRMHNTLRKDRYNPTQYQEEFKMLALKSNKSYTELPLGKQGGVQVEADWQPDGNQLEPQYSIGKYSIDKVSEGEGKSPRHKYGNYKNVLLSDEDLAKLQKEFPSDWENWIERVSEYVASKGKSYKDYLATIRRWARTDKERQPKGKMNERPRQDDLDDLF